jgi:hypothetical protein
MCLYRNGTTADMTLPADVFRISLCQQRSDNCGMILSARVPADVRHVGVWKSVHRCSNTFGYRESHLMSIVQTIECALRRCLLDIPASHLKP